MSSLPTGTVTFLFTDIEGSTDPEDQARAALDPEAFERAFAEGRGWDAATVRSRLLPSTT